jgi:hypothetical protein
MTAWYRITGPSPTGGEFNLLVLVVADRVAAGTDPVNNWPAVGALWNQVLVELWHLGGAAVPED